MLRISSAAALALGALLACTTIASAQDAPKQGKKGKGAPTIEQQMDRLSTELKLTDDQKPKVKAVLEDSQKKRQELRGVPQDERRGKMQALTEAQDKKMKEILKPDQFEKYKELQKEMRQRRGGKGGAGAAEGATAPKKSDSKAE
jgi:Spy/CpxP family protein refolding chaperone